MNYKVIYFTRTGNSRRVAAKIAKKLSTEAMEITDNKNWRGIIGFIKGGMYATRNKAVEIKIPQNLDEAEEIIVVSPIWAGKLVPAIRTFLENRSREKMHLVATSGGTIISDRSGYKTVTDIVKKNKNEDALIDELVSKLI